MYPHIFWGEVVRPDTYEIEKISGCTFADTWAEAMENIEEYYGDELTSIHIEQLEESGIIEFTNPKEGKNIVKAQY